MFPLLLNNKLKSRQSKLPSQTPSVTDMLLVAKLILLAVKQLVQKQAARTPSVTACTFSGTNFANIDRERI